MSRILQNTVCKYPSHKSYNADDCLRCADFGHTVCININYTHSRGDSRPRCFAAQLHPDPLGTIPTFSSDTTSLNRHIHPVPHHIPQPPSLSYPTSPHSATITFPPHTHHLTQPPETSPSRLRPTQCHCIRYVCLNPKRYLLPHHTPIRIIWQFALENCYTSTSRF